MDWKKACKILAKRHYGLNMEAMEVAWGAMVYLCEEKGHRSWQKCFESLLRWAFGRDLSEFSESTIELMVSYWDWRQELPTPIPANAQAFGLDGCDIEDLSGRDTFTQDPNFDSSLM